MIMAQSAVNILCLVHALWSFTVHRTLADRKGLHALY